MTGPAAGALRADTGMRLLRAVAFSAVCVPVSACAHMAAAGTGLSWRSLLAGLLAMLCLVTPLTGRERSRAGIVATLLCGQVILHALFCLGEHGAAGGMPASMPGTAVHDTAGHGAGLPVPLMPSPVMFLVHLAAAFLLGWAVHRGERAVWLLVRASRRAAGRLAECAAALPALILTRPVAVPVGGARIFARRRDRQAMPDGIVLLHHAVIRRGPPTADMSRRFARAA
jgi:hypothetical protein